ncbi:MULTISPECIES: FAD:protein FMN transferase [Sphingobium]|jgi:FAD:protein FMN transferase|uniref:FAD:protein FMN transferase n=1 Tax=Sphingobium TaxID=165695 RepID=UPI000C60604B|nr:MULTISPECIES: FAD:protein FMN transferase [Sphingobium]MBS48415.1 thiamine biosynthesis protein ApbE [Sphingobium sp.]MCC4258308.1 FAD:protein FMN transferase [Sphingobium lactosutens]MEC9017038.1 FAD:protein FMN transferase [Pseudomonadota bacterium]HCW59887.1 thiamine biosynthesis protein ApbE [Sphingobium sp.]|tara:strand:+ start:4122 stop:4985 length:864 start_codon:yes stop_codon:yes gene_type:complete
MGTTWSASIVDPPADAEMTIRTKLNMVIAQMSNWDADSVISRFNRQPIGAWMTLPVEMMTVLRTGMDISRLSGGAFDPALGQLVGQCGFGPHVADEAPACGSAATSVEVGDHGARRLADVALDFSGIAKGFAVDAVADALRVLGAANFLIEIGGELRGAGVKPDIQPWWVDMETPPGMALPPMRVALSGLAIATSGDYRRFHMVAGKRLSHSIDPGTGAPIQNGVACVTVLHDSAMMADAWATAITVAGPGKGLSLAREHGLAARMIVRTDNGPREHLTPALEMMLA